MTSINLLDVFLLSLLTAAATGVGALPFLWVRNPGRRWLGYGNAIAAGLMLAASGQLVFEGWLVDPGRLAVGVLGGLLFIAASRWFLGRFDDISVGALRGADARRGLLIVGVMTVHSVAEGVGMGVAFGGGAELGLFISLAIAVHNIPEGLAISLVLIPRGVSVWKAGAWSFFSSLPQPLLAVPAFLFVLQFQEFLAAGFGFAAGAMGWMVLKELIPEAREETGSTWRPWVVAAGAAVVMGVLQVVLRG
jgi:zinc transporter ZupT